MDILTTEDVKDALVAAAAAYKSDDADKQLAGSILIASAIKDHAGAMGRLADYVAKLADNFRIMNYNFEGIKQAMNKRNEIEKEKTN